MPLAYIRMLHRGPHAGHELPGYGHPDQGLPEHPIDPGFGGGIGAPPDPGFDIPLPPPGVWPPPNSTLPIVPAPPGTPPGAIWPSPGRPPRPGHDLPSAGHPGGGPMPGGERPGNALPDAPARPGNELPSKVYWVLCWNSLTGWAYHAVDPSLVAGQPLPPAPEPK